jgi:streptogramin lyase
LQNFFLGDVHAASVKVLAGTGSKGFSPDGTKASEAQLNNVFGITRGPDGAIYFCDTDNQLIRKIHGGIITTVVGSKRRGYQPRPASALEADLNEPYEVRVAANGDLFWVERMNHLVRQLDGSGKITTLAGSGRPGFAGDLQAMRFAQFNQPHSIQFDHQGNLLICDIGNHRIRRLDLKRDLVTSIAGNGQPRTAPNNSAYFQAPLHGPRAVDVDSQGNIWVALREGNSIYKLTPKDGTLHHIAGCGEKGFVEGPAKQAKLAGPKGIAVGLDGNIYFADTENHCIRRVVVRTGQVETVVGTGEPGDGPDGDPRQCKLRRPHGVYVDKDGSILIGDSENNRIRQYIP